MSSEGAELALVRTAFQGVDVYVDPVPSDPHIVQSWVQSALRHNRTLPSKGAARARSAAPKKRKTIRRRTHP